MSDKALSASRRAILTELRRRGAMTVDALVDATGLSKTATRAHLVRMERDGAVARMSITTDGPGRPPAAFGLTDHGASMFPTADDALLSRLLHFLAQNDAGELVAAFFEDLWAQRMCELQETLGSTDLLALSLDERLKAVESVLAEGHFMPSIERESRADGSETVTVSECNCPFPAAARASRLPCRLEVDFLSRVIGGTARSVSIASSRKDTCTFEFRVAPQASH